MSGDSPAARGLTIPGAARLLRIGKDRVRGLIRRGELVAVNLGGPTRPRLVILPADLESFLAARRVRPTPKPRRQKRTPAGQTDFYPD
jgi:excisionase family DNA binding protein